ncbi:MAG: spore coat associated protein CotJA [Firmicutes bacterium]|nr:spore coat associated protein CotJA [Bacillota bacterium]
MSEMRKPCCSYPRCGCVAYAYVPVQEMEETYDACTGLTQGTIFPELDLNICEYGAVCKQWGGAME